MNSENSWIGTDESGKGDYFGPLVIAGVKLYPGEEDHLRSLGVRDSKKMSDSTALRLAREIEAECESSVVVIGPERYNELYEKMKNLNHLLAWGHARVIENMLEKSSASRVVTDQFGDAKYVENALLKKGREVKLEQRHRAESDPAVAAASVLARAEFLRRLERLSNMIGKTLPKGASPEVISVARALVREQGEEVLRRVAKIHFKTTQSVLGHS